MPGSLLDLAGHANTDKSVVWLELLHGLWGVVDERETGALAATVLGLEAEDGDLVLGGLVELRELAAELVLGDIWAVWVEDITVGKSCVSSMTLLMPAVCVVSSSLMDGRALLEGCGICTHTTICLRPSRGLRMNLRVRRVT